MKKKIFSAVLTAIMAFTLLAGCSGNKSGDTIKVGILGPHTGENAVYGIAVRNGAQLYIDQINADGGINGKQIETIVYDNKGDISEAITAFSRMVDKGITALIGDVLTGNTIAVVGEAYPINMPMITASATAVAVTYDKENDKVFSNVYRTCFIDPFQGEKMAEYAGEALKAKTAAVIFETGNDYSVGLKDAFVAKCTELGITVVGEEGYATGDVDFNSQLTNILSKSPDVVFCPNYYEDDGLIITQARAIGLKATFLGGDGWSGVSGYASAEDLEGSFYCSPYAASSTEEVIAFEEAYIAKYGKDTLNMFSATAYDAAKIMVAALTETESQNLTAGSDEYKQAVIDAIGATTVAGITSAGGYAFDEYNNPIKDAVIIKLEDGEEVFSQMY